MPSDVAPLDCLDMISQTRPGQNRLRKVRIEMDNNNMVELFMEGLIPRILERLRALQSLELMFNGNDKGWASGAFPNTSTRGRCCRLFCRRFLLVIRTELAHVRVVTTGHDNVDEGPCQWVLDQLQRRNRAWTPLPPGVNHFTRTICTMKGWNPTAIAIALDVVDKCRAKKGLHSPGNPLSVFD